MRCCDECVERIESGKYDVIILNFANCDMVGHTGVFEAAVKAVEAVDECVGRVVDAIREMGGIALITADHGNADQMHEPDGEPLHRPHHQSGALLRRGRGDVKLRRAAVWPISPPPCWI